VPIPTSIRIEPSTSTAITFVDTGRPPRTHTHTRFWSNDQRYAPGLRRIPSRNLWTVTNPPHQPRGSDFSLGARARSRDSYIPMTPTQSDSYSNTPNACKPSIAKLCSDTSQVGDPVDHCGLDHNTILFLSSNGSVYETPHNKMAANFHVLPRSLRATPFSCNYLDHGHKPPATGKSGGCSLTIVCGHRGHESREGDLEHRTSQGWF